LKLGCATVAFDEDVVGGAARAVAELTQAARNTSDATHSVALELQCMRPPSFLESILFFSIFALPQAYISELALGVPAWLVIRHYGIRAWSVFAIGGAVLGMAYYVAYDVARYVGAEAFAYEFVRYEHTRDLNPLHPLLAMPAGLVAAITFRAIVFPRKRIGKPLELDKPR